jgi:hypothetical protein
MQRALCVQAGEVSTRTVHGLTAGSAPKECPESRVAQDDGRGGAGMRSVQERPCSGRRAGGEG